MKMKCIGGLANGEIVEVEHGSSRVHDIIQVRAKVTFELESFHESIKKLMDTTALFVPYYHYRICVIQKENKGYRQKLFYLCPEKWDDFEALSYLIGA